MTLLMFPPNITIQLGSKITIVQLVGALRLMKVTPTLTLTLTLTLTAAGETLTLTLTTAPAPKPKPKPKPKPRPNPNPNPNPNQVVSVCFPIGIDIFLQALEWKYASS